MCVFQCETGEAMKVYVAGAYGERLTRVRPMIDRLQATGIVEITHDWTRVEAPAVPESDMSSDFRRRCVGDDLRGVRSADVFWLMVPPYGEGAGCWVEMGHALHKCRIIVSGPYRERSIFTELANMSFPTDDEAFHLFVPKAEP